MKRDIMTPSHDGSIKILIDGQKSSLLSHLFCMKTIIISIHFTSLYVLIMIARKTKNYRVRIMH
jgi:hypothetical protein